MAVVNVNLTSDLQKPVSVVNICNGNFYFEDANANTVRVTVFDGGTPATISGTVSAKVILPNGTTVTVTGGTISGNVVSITLPASVYAVPGIISVCVKVTASSVITTIAAFTICVYKAAT